MKRNLIIRADAGTRIGTGHVMRCLALAQAWRDAGGNAAFVTVMESPVLEDRLRAEGMEVIRLAVEPGSADDANRTKALAQNMGAVWAVVDGYHFGVGYRRIIKDAGLHLLFIDDNGHDGDCYADIVLNQNIHAHRGLYPNREPYTRFLLGPNYFLLRQEFLKWREWNRKTPKTARKLLVTLGGSDPDNVTLKVIRALEQAEINGLEILVVAGGNNPHFEELQSIIDNSPLSAQMERDPIDMPELMAWADVGIAAGGCTSWELSFMGLPSLLFILSINQQHVAESIHRQGAAKNLGRHRNISLSRVTHAINRFLLDSDMRKNMVLRGRELIDVWGPARIMMCMEHISLRFNQVSEKDCRLIWEWANDVDTRQASFSSQPIPLENHIQWFDSKLNDPNCIFYMMSNGGGSPVGQVRYELDGSEAVISMTIDSRYRRKGYGSATILLSAHQIFDVSGVQVIHAYVKQENRRSIRAFLKAGFKARDTRMIKGHKSLKLTMAREEVP